MLFKNLNKSGACVCSGYQAFSPLSPIGRPGDEARLYYVFHVCSDNVCRADSVTWNPHKSLGVPLQCSSFLTKHGGLLASCNSTKATYLFQQDKVGYDVSYDTGDKSIQCGRLNDVFKLWLMWKKKVKYVL
jgi:glutamate/tyrosine decarboxylase-like PLP-dependent enzyme